MTLQFAKEPKLVCCAAGSSPRPSTTCGGMSTSRTAMAEDIASTLAAWLPLSTLSPDVRRLVEDSFVPVSYPFGAVVFREGDAADAFYLIVQGTVRVLKQTGDGREITLNSLGPGQGFGEAELLQETARNATLRASSDVRALRLDRSLFLALARQNNQLLVELDLQVSHHHLWNLLRLHSVFARLTATTLSQLVAELRPHSLQVGERLFSEGEPAGSVFVVKDGHLRAYRTSGSCPPGCAIASTSWASMTSQSSRGGTASR